MPQDMTPYTGSESFIFVSYSHRDADRVLPAVRRMIAAGFRIWYDDAIELGREWDNDIALHVRDCTVFIPFLTANYMASVNCKNELRYALSKSCKCLAVYLEEVSFESDPGIEMYINVNQNIMAQRLTPEAFFTRLAKVPLLQSCRHKPKPDQVQPAAPAPAPQQTAVQQLTPPQEPVIEGRPQPQTGQYTPPQQFAQQSVQPQQFTQQSVQPVQQQYAQPNRMTPPPQNVQQMPQQTRQPFVQQTAQPQPYPQGQPFVQPQTGYQQAPAQTAQVPVQTAQVPAQTAQASAKTAKYGGSAPDAGWVVLLLDVLGIFYSILITRGAAAALKEDDHYGITVAIALFCAIPAAIGLIMIHVTESRYPEPRTDGNPGLFMRYVITGYNILFPLMMFGHGSTYNWQFYSNIMIGAFIWMIVKVGVNLRQIPGGNKLRTAVAFFWTFVVCVVSSCISKDSWYYDGEAVQGLFIALYCVSVIRSEVALLKKKEYGNSSKKSMIKRIVALGILAALIVLCSIDSFRRAERIPIE